MLNTEHFLKRLEVLFANHGLTAASFSDKIGVQRSGVSHLLSGRNKPSLDFILKIMAAFPETDLYWLLTGKESNGKENPVAFDLKKETDNGIERIIIFRTDGSFKEYLP